VTEPETPIAVLLVEDNEVYRESLVFLLQRVVGLEVVGAVADGTAATPACFDLDPDVVVLDYRLPDLDGAEVATDLRERCPGIAVVLLSGWGGRGE